MLLVTIKGYYYYYYCRSSMPRLSQTFYKVPYCDKHSLRWLDEHHKPRWKCTSETHAHTHTHTHDAALWPWLYPKLPPLPSTSALFEVTAILNSVRNHSGCSRVHSFNPTMHRKTSVQPMYTQRLENPIMHFESHALHEFPRLGRRWRSQRN